MNTFLPPLRSSLLGKTILLHEMNDPYPLPTGSRGVIHHIDDLGQFHVNWENGRVLAVIPELDKFEILED
jgi:hypothetical protein